MEIISPINVNFSGHYNYDFHELINKLYSEINNLNQLILEYNNEQSLIDKKEIILEIYYYQKYITRHYRRDFIATVPKLVQALFTKLFQDIRKVVQKLGYSSLYEPDLDAIERDICAISETKKRMAKKLFTVFFDNLVGTSFIDKYKYDKTVIPMLIQFRQDMRQKITKENKSLHRELIIGINLTLMELQQTLGSHTIINSCFPSLIANMDSVIINKLAGELFKISQLTGQERTTASAGVLAAVSTQMNSSPYAQAYQKFTTEHSICFLGGGNSKNFLIVHTLTGERFILKIESSRFSGAQDIVDKLNAPTSLNTPLLSVFAERPITFSIQYKNEIQTHFSRLLVTETCRGGDLEAHSRIIAGESVTDKHQMTVYYYQQMADILLLFQKNNVGFPDMKNSNWLIDEHKRLRIADTKSFLPTENGVYQPTMNTKMGYPNFITSKFMNPPWLERDNVNIEQLHAYMLGKNIYQYLTGCNYHALSHIKSAANCGFSTDFFANSVGKEFQALIEGLIDSKLSVSSGLQKLKTINSMMINPFSTRCYSLLEQIRQQQINDYDLLLLDYVNKMTATIEQVNNPLQFQQLECDLTTILASVSSPQVQQLKSIIKQFRHDANQLLAINRTEKNKKADMIEKMLQKIPLKDRSTAFDSSVELKKALAYRRYFKKDIAKADTSGNTVIIEKNAARSYHKMKRFVLDNKKSSTI